MIANATDVALFFGVHRSTIVKWARDGCPYIQKSDVRNKQEWQFETKEVAKWREERAAQAAVGDTQITTEEELKRRKLAAETSIAELAAMEAKGQVVKIDDAIKDIADGFVSMKQRARTIPARLAPLLVGETDETKIKAEIIAEIDEALNELSDRFIHWSEAVPGEVSGSVEASEAAPETNDK